MLKVGITGNIGSGKTTVCKIFELLNVEIYYSDEKAKEFLYDWQVKKSIREIFGDVVFDEAGNIIKHKLAGIVFNDSKALHELNSLIHPLVKSDFNSWVERWSPGKPYVLQEAAILFEAGMDKALDKVILVVSPTEMMVNRVMNRDNVTMESVRARLNNQMDQQKKIAMADYVIYNDEDKLLIPQVVDIHNDLINRGDKP